MTTTNRKTADLCDDFSDQLSIVEPGFQHYGGKQMFSGQISTIKCFEDNSKVREQVSTPGNGRVLVVDAGGSKRCAMLGDLLAAKAVENGWSGVIMYSLIRDCAEIGTMQLGVMALGTHPLKSEKKNLGEVDIPVTFGGVTFTPGEWLYADEDGIVVSQRALT